MSGKLRIFISSTMKDLANERSEVRTKLINFNFEPVNAENLPSSDKRSWDTLEEEIRSCNVFVLILGDRYGWSPDDGPHANEGLSITHLEYLEAKAHGLPILPFLKELSYEDTNRDSDDSKKRDAFRQEIRDYAKGLFTSKYFKLASELANLVGEALINLVSDSFASEQVASRAEVANQVARSLKQSQPVTPPPSVFVIPPALVDAVAERQAVLFAGAGFSLSAGLPSASAFSERYRQSIRVDAPDYDVNNVGTALAGVATDLEIIAGRQSLVDAVLGLLHLPQGVKPTSAHFQAVKLFDQIITTNFDTLFEKAAAASGVELPLLFEETPRESIPEKMILKLHGSEDAPDSLVLTETEILLLDQKRAGLWQAILHLFTTRPVVVVGTSLRDPSIIRLFTEGGDRLSGFFVAPNIDETTKARVSRWNLQCIPADANSFFERLASLMSQPQ